MKRDKIIYWTTTGLISFGMLFSAYQYFTTQEMVNAYKHMGYPDFLRVEIGAAKIVGTLVLLLPFFSVKIKEWAYAGFGILFFSASLTHYLLNDPTERIITPLVFLFLLVLSNIFYPK